MLTQTYSITNTWLYLFVIAALEALAVYTWRFRERPGAITVIFAQLGKIIWLVALLQINASPNLEGKLFWVAIQKIIACLLPYIWLVFALQLSWQKNRIPAIIHIGFGSIIVGLAVLLLSNWQGLVCQTAWLSGQTITLVAGPGQRFAIGWAYFTGVITTVVVVRWIVLSAGLRRKQAVWYLGAVLLAWVSHAIWTLSGGRIESIPWGFLFNSLLVVWIFYRWNLYSLTPLAQAEASRHVIDGLLVFDEEDYVVYINPAAEKMLTDVPATIGDKLQALAAVWPALAQAANEPEPVETARNDPEGSRYYQMRRIPLESASGHPLGYIILLNDISQQKHAQEQIVDQEKALSILTERERLGRELHDGRVQLWNYFHMELRLVQTLLTKHHNADANHHLEQLLSVLEKLNSDDREAIAGLKKSDSSQNDFASNLGTYLAWYEKAHAIRVQLVLPPEPLTCLFSPTVEVQLLRIVQEAMTNIRKHAQARQVKVRIESTPEQATVLIEDDGCGFDPADLPASRNFGLKIMAERAKEAGGELRLHSSPGQGTTIWVLIPLKKQKIG
ncbi:MAG: liaS [Firmicutes bacterium]|nr:liaS [Bacillota bacterium]